MVDMHENSPKTLRQNLLKERTTFAAKQNYAQIQADLIDHLIQLLAEQGSSWQSIALYWPIQDEVDLRSTLLAWVKKAPGRTLTLPFARPDKHLDFYQWCQGDKLIPSKHGVPEPDPNNATRPLLNPDCILIPCVGWSSSAVDGKTHYWRLGYGGGYFEKEKPGLEDGVSLRESMDADSTEPNYNYDIDPLTGSAPERKIGRTNNYEVSGKRGTRFLIGEM